MSRTVTVKVQPDHLEKLARCSAPVAVSELIWNALDADATRVEVCLHRGALGAIEEIRVEDDGHGIPHESAGDLFASLGGSWKRRGRTQGIGRALHGKDGKGRFRAFALGETVEWQTRWRDDGGAVLGYAVQGSRGRLSRFTVDDPEPSDDGSGTSVVVTGVREHLGSIEGADAIQRVAQEFAPYLLQYPNVELVYDATRIQLNDLDARQTTLDLEPVKVGEGHFAEASLLVVEWSSATERGLYLCDADGIALASMAPGIRAPRFHFTAYLRSSYIREVAAEKGDELLEMDAGVQSLVDAAKEALRRHFRERLAEFALEAVERWREERIYPYEGEPADPVEAVERQVFDVVALNVQAYLPAFEESDAGSKRLSFRLIREALRESPQALTRILTEAIGLPRERQLELARLLERTTLSAIISATRLVADRLDFLRGLEALVFDPQSKKETLERQQLHRVIAEETWIFGEHFALSNSDESLTEVLRKHRRFLGDDVVIDEPVTREDGSEGFPDLVCSREIPRSRAEEHEFLVVELKRPSVKVDSEGLTQIKRYANAIMGDERFDQERSRWEFWIVSNEVDVIAQRERSQPSRDFGIVQVGEKPPHVIRARTWSEILNEARSRLSLFQKRLELEATHDSGLCYLRETHAKYLPDSLREGQEAEPGGEDPAQAAG